MNEYFRDKKIREERAMKKYTDLENPVQALKEYKKIMYETGGNDEDRRQWAYDASYIRKKFGIVDFFDGKPYLKK